MMKTLRSNGQWEIRSHPQASHTLHPEPVSLRRKLFDVGARSVFNAYGFAYGN